MNMIKALVIAVGIAGLSACGGNNSAEENAAENIQANAENVADDLEQQADDATSENAEDALENQADATRDAADNKAEDLTTNDPDTNLANGM